MAFGGSPPTPQPPCEDRVCIVANNVMYRCRLCREGAVRLFAAAAKKIACRRRHFFAFSKLAQGAYVGFICFFRPEGPWRANLLLFFQMRLCRAAPSSPRTTRNAICYLFLIAPRAPQKNRAAPMATATVAVTTSATSAARW